MLKPLYMGLGEISVIINKPTSDSKLVCGISYFFGFIVTPLEYFNPLKRLVFVMYPRTCEEVPLCQQIYMSVVFCLYCSLHVVVHTVIGRLGSDSQCL
jgi:hypothetical protein